MVRHPVPRSPSYLGKIVEIADRETIYSRAHHPYTQALLSAVPDVAQGRDRGRRERIMLEGDVPAPSTRRPGAAPARCSLAQEICAKVEPPLLQIGPRHKVACHFAGELGHHPQTPVTKELLAVDDQGSPVPGATPTPLDLGPRWADEWFDVKTKTMVLGLTLLTDGRSATVR